MRREIAVAWRQFSHGHRGDEVGGENIFLAVHLEDRVKPFENRRRRCSLYQRNDRARVKPVQQGGLHVDEKEIQAATPDPQGNRVVSVTAK